MPPSLPATDLSPHLLWAEDGSPRSGRFDDVYFSREDGLAESRTVFLSGCDLPAAWSGRSRFTVAELGFGTGLNIAALLDLWHHTAPPDAHLHIFSVEGFPLSVDEARRALGAWPGISEAAAALLAVWPAGTPGIHRVALPGYRASLELAIGDVAWALETWHGHADAWFLDGFAPATNPDMWSPRVFDAIAARSAPDARLATFTVAGAVRRGLSQRGFDVAKRPGHGRKRERLEARRLPTASAAVSPPSIAIIGAGIAGAALARALTELGANPTVIESVGPGAGGSGFPASLVTPRLDVGDPIIASLAAHALKRAGDLYAEVPGAVLAQGVIQLEQTARDAGRFTKVAAQSLWTPGDMTPLPADRAAARLGEPVGTGGLAMHGALTVRPAVILNAWLADRSQIQANVHRLDLESGVWRLMDAEDHVILTVDRVIIAAGWGSAILIADHPDAPALTPVRGQAEWVEGLSTPAVAWGGYAIPTADGILYGATHDRHQTDTDIRTDDSTRNLQTLHSRLPILASRVEATGPGHSRAAIRATTADRLPLAGPLSGAPGVYLLTGLGSRAFSFAPLLAEHVAALVLGVESPLNAELAVRVDPARLDDPKGLAKSAAGADV